MGITARSSGRWGWVQKSSIGIVSSWTSLYCQNRLTVVIEWFSKTVIFFQTLNPRNTFEQHRDWLQSETIVLTFFIFYIPLKGFCWILKSLENPENVYNYYLNSLVQFGWALSVKRGCRNFKAYVGGHKAVKVSRAMYGRRGKNGIGRW